MAVAAAFGLSSTRYQIGQFAHSGPGLFPLMVSCMLFVIGIATVIRSCLMESVPANYTFKNIAIILVSLCGFALLAKHLNLVAGVIFLVFVSSSAGQGYSASRNLKISAVLILIALAFHKLLGLNLPIY